MNMQAMLKQAQKLQKDMLNAQQEINNMSFVSKNGIVEITMKGNKKVEKVKIERDDSFSADDLEMLEDMILVSVNDALSQIEKVTEEKMGKYTNGLPGLF